MTVCAGGCGQQSLSGRFIKRETTHFPVRPPRSTSVSAQLKLSTPGDKLCVDADRRSSVVRRHVFLLSATASPCGVERSSWRCELRWGEVVTAPPRYYCATTHCCCQPRPVRRPYHYSTSHCHPTSHHLSAGPGSPGETLCCMVRPGGSLQLCSCCAPLPCTNSSDEGPQKYSLTALMSTR